MLSGLTFVLAIDHRSSLRRWYEEITGEEPDARRLARAKGIVLDGLVMALGRGVAAHEAAILVDEEYGAEVLSRARDLGVTTIVPVERSGRPGFELEHGEAFGDYIEAADPDLVKALVRYNPDGDEALNARSRHQLDRVSRWLSSTGRGLMVEILVPPEPPQLGAVEGSRERYDNELRPALTARAIAELRQAGISPQVWKTEGQPTARACRLVAAATAGPSAARPGPGASTSGPGAVASSDGPPAPCLVLGRAAEAATVEAWLVTAAPDPGFAGFAIGRTIWAGPLAEHLLGRRDEPAVASTIADHYLHFVDVYRAHAARGPTDPHHPARSLQDGAAKTTGPGGGTKGDAP